MKQRRTSLVHCLRTFTAPCATITLLSGISLLMFGRGRARKSEQYGPPSGEMSPVSEDARLVEPMGHDIAWGELTQLDSRYGTTPYRLTRQIILLGRQIGCDVLLDDERASRYHVVITWEGKRATVRNIGTNGTLVNGYPLLNTAALRHGDIIEVASARFRFGYTSESGLLSLESQPTETFALPDKAASADARPTVKATLTELTGPEPGRSWPIVSGAVGIGRDSNNLIVLPHASVSRHHAQIIVQPAGLFVQDIGSSNGTAVNGEALIAPYALQNGDHIQIGDILLVLKLEAPMVKPEELPTQHLPFPGTSAGIPPFQRSGPLTRPRRSSPGEGDNAPSAPPPPSQFRPPLSTLPLSPRSGPIAPNPPENDPRVPRFRPPPSDGTENG